MKKKIAPILILIHVVAGLINCSAQSNKYIYTKVLVNDCLTCYAGFGFLEDVDKSIPIQLVFPQMEEKRVKHFLKNNKGLKGSYPYIISDSLYKALGRHLSSEVIVMENGVEVQRQLLKDFRGISSPSEPVLRMQLPDSVIFSYVTVGLNNKCITLADLQYNNLYLINKKNWELISVITEEQLDPLPAIRKVNPAAVLRIESASQENLDFLRSISGDKIRILHSSSISGDGIFVPAEIYYPEVIRDTIEFINRFGGLLSIKNEKEVNFIPPKNLPNKTYLSGEVMHISNNKLIASMLPVKPQKPFLAEYDFVNIDSLMFVRYFPFEYPKEYADSLKGFKVKLGFAYPYVYTAFSNKLWNVETEETKYLPFKQTKLSYDRKRAERQVIYDYSIVEGVLVSNNVLRLLLLIDDKYFIKDIDLAFMSVINEQPITIPEKIQSEVYFFDKDTLLFIKDEGIYTLNINN